MALNNYKKDRSELKSLYNRLKPDYEKAIGCVYGRIRELLETKGYSPTIKYRVKRFDSYYDKLSSNIKGSTKAARPVTDIIGFRIISPFMEDVEQIEDLLAGSFNVVEIVRKGTDHSFREFGYDSVHLLIKLDDQSLNETLPGTSAVCEVQLRTILQDAWAEVEHELIYKSDIEMPNITIRRKLASLNASLALSDLIFQEIRDYQKGLRFKGQKRRKSLESNIDYSALVTISHRPSYSDNLSNMPPFDLPTPLGGTHLERLMLKALSDHSNNDFKEAIKCYNAILRMRLDDKLKSLVYNHRGMARFSLVDYRRAIQDFSKAILLDDSNYRAYCNRGLTHRMTGEYNLSVVDYDRAIDIKPLLVDGYWGRAQSYFEMKLFTKAIEDCRLTLSLDEDYSPAEELIKMAHRNFSDM